MSSAVRRNPPKWDEIDLSRVNEREPALRASKRWLRFNAWHLDADAEETQRLLDAFGATFSQSDDLAEIFERPDQIDSAHFWPALKALVDLFIERWAPEVCAASAARADRDRTVSAAILEGFAANAEGPVATEALARAALYREELRRRPHSLKAPGRGRPPKRESAFALLLEAGLPHVTKRDAAAVAADLLDHFLGIETSAEALRWRTKKTGQRRKAAAA